MFSILTIEDKIKNMLKRFSLMLYLVCEISIIFAQSNSVCSQESKAMFKISDWHSDQILLMTSADSLYLHYGKAKKTFPRLQYSVTDSLVNTDDGGFHRYTSTVAIRFIHYSGWHYVQYKDSVQLIFIDFKKTNAKLYVNKICFDKNLSIDDFLQIYKGCDSCVQKQAEGHYNSGLGKHKEVYKFSFFSDFTTFSKVDIYFDAKTRKLWYMEMDFNQNGGIIKRRTGFVNSCDIK